MLDFVAKRYGKLPSEVMEFGDSIDMRVATISLQFENYQNNKGKDGNNDNHGLSQEQMQAMMQQVRENGRKDNKKQDTN